MTTAAITYKMGPSVRVCHVVPGNQLMFEPFESSTGHRVDVEDMSGWTAGRTLRDSVPARVIGVNRLRTGRQMGYIIRAIRLDNGHQIQTIVLFGQNVIKTATPRSAVR